MVIHDNHCIGNVVDSNKTEGSDESACLEENETVASKPGSDDPTDGRKRLEWESYYPREANKEICLETIYLLGLLLLAIVIIYLSWNNWLCDFLYLSDELKSTFKKYIYYSMAGLLGGVIFDFKNLYKAVARGYWHIDRRIWRVISPIVATIVAFIVGAMIESSLLSSVSSTKSSASVSIGFVSGYFADRAIGKMREVAAVVFGKSTASKDDGKM